MKDMNNSPEFTKNKKLRFTYLVILLLFLTVIIPYANSEEQIVSCTLSISDRSLGFNENANIEINCVDSPDEFEIEAFLDYGGICQLQYGASVCTYSNGLWSCTLRPSIGIPRIFYTDTNSPCFNSQDAYIPREICIYAVLHTAGGATIQQFGHCASGFGSDYLTYEVPRIDATTSIAYLNEPKTMTISGAMFDGFPYPPLNAVEIDWDCPPTSSPNGLICNDASFSVDQTYTTDQLGQYSFQFFPITHTYTGSQGYKYVGLRVYNRFAAKKTASLELDVRDRQTPPPPPPPPPPPICTNYCCQAGYSCVGSSIPGTSCPTTCCNVPCLPNCATLSGTGCSQGQLCQGGQFVDSGDYGTGSQSRCCVGGTCYQEPSLCTDYSGGHCCPEDSYCVGGTRQINVGGCSSLTQCFTGCTEPFQCVTDNQLCSETNLGSCDLPNKGEEKCAGGSLTCICDGADWYMSQSCQDWCGDVSGFIGGRPMQQDIDVLNENEASLRSEVQMCSLQQTFERRCVDSDEGKNPIATLGTCTQGNNVYVDEYVDDTHIKEWSCSVEHKCISKEVQCPPGKKALGGMCVSKQDCIEIVGSGIENDLACGVRFSTTGQLIVHKSYNNIIEVCEMDVIRPWLNNNVFNDANNGDTLLKELALKKYDNLANKIFDKTLALYTSCQINSPAQCGDPNVPSASDLYRTPEIQECWLWSAALYSTLRTAGVPGERVFIGAYDFKDVDDPSHPFVPSISHQLVIYDVDAIDPNLFTIMDITSGHARFPVQQWNQYRGDLDLCKAYYFDDALGNTEWRGMNALSRIKPSIPYCADVCSDGTRGNQCSSFNGLVCDTNGVLQYNANQCGCPISSDVWQSQIPGSTIINCVCPQTLNNQQGHCISDGQQPLFCGRFIGNAPNRDQTANVPVGLARYDCKGPDRVAGTQDDCGCGSGYSCVDSSSIGYVNADFGICVPI